MSAQTRNTVYANTNTTLIVCMLLRMFFKSSYKSSVIILETIACKITIDVFNYDKLIYM